MYCVLIVKIKKLIFHCVYKCTVASLCQIKLCYHTEDQRKLSVKFEVHKDKTLLEATQLARQVGATGNTEDMNFVIFFQELKFSRNNKKKKEKNFNKNKKQNKRRQPPPFPCPAIKKKILKKVTHPFSSLTDSLTPSLYPQLFEIEESVPKDCCRLVKYDEQQDSLERSYEGEENTSIAALLGGVRAYYTFDLLLETKRMDEEFLEYRPGGVFVWFELISLVVCLF